MTPEERAAIEAEIERWKERWGEYRETAGWIAQATTDGPPDVDGEAGGTQPDVGEPDDTTA